MIFIRKNIHLLNLVWLLVACSNSGGGGASSPVPEILDPVAAFQKTVTTHQWCRVDDWQDFQVVLRAQLSASQINFQYLRVTPNEAPLMYRFQDSPAWIERPNEIEIPDASHSMVTLFNNNTEISKLDGFPEQQRIHDEVFAHNSQLAHNEVSFDPSLALRVLSRSLVTGEQMVRNMYPCEAYSPTLSSSDWGVRPLTEMIMMLAQQSGGFAPENQDHLATVLKFKFPLDEFPASAGALEKTQWCSWHEVETDHFLMRSLTVAAGKFIENIHTEEFLSYDDPEERKAFLAKAARHGETYDMSFSPKGRLMGMNLTPADQQRNPAQELFTLVKDSNGHTALVRLDLKQTEWSRPAFDDIFFDCSISSPLDFSPGFRAELKEILQLEMNQLIPPPATSGDASSGASAGSI